MMATWVGVVATSVLLCLATLLGGTDAAYQTHEGGGGVSCFILPSSINGPYWTVLSVLLDPTAAAPLAPPTYLVQLNCKRAANLLQL